MRLQQFLKSLCCCWTLKIGGYIIGGLGVFFSCALFCVTIIVSFIFGDMLHNYDEILKIEGQHHKVISKEEFESRVEGENFDFN